MAGAGTTAAARPEPVPCLVEGSTLVAELGAPAGLAAWRALRDLRLWAGAPPVERAGLFGARAGVLRREALGDGRLEAELAGLLGVFARVVVAPEEVDEAALRAACARLARWLEARGAHASARAFRAAAAETWPEVGAERRTSS